MPIARSSGSSSALQLLEEARHLLDGIDPLRLAQVDDVGRRPDLDRLVSAIRSRLSMLSNAIGAESFMRFRPQQSMAGLLDNVRAPDVGPVDSGGPT